MNFLAALHESISFNNFELGSCHWVNVTHINDPNDFYVRLTSHDTYLPEIESRGDQLFAHEAKMGYGVIYKSPIIESYIRGQITYIDDAEQTYDIFAIDYGCFESGIPLKSIYKPFYEVTIPPLAVSCTLTECYPVKGDKWSQDSIQAMKDYVASEQVKVIVKCKTADKLEVEISNSCPSEIGTLLALTGYSRLACGQNTLSRLTVPAGAPKYCYKYMEPSLFDVIHVRLQKITQTNEFYVAKVDLFKKYIMQRNELHQYANHCRKSLTIEEAKVGLPVAIRSNIDFIYERGAIVDIGPEENKLSIRYVDWGHVVSVDVSNVKPITCEIYLVDSPIAFKCITFEDKDEDLLYRNSVPGTEFIITVKDIIEELQNVYMVSLALKKT